MPTRTGNATADLYALLAERCPDVAARLLDGQGLGDALAASVDAGGAGPSDPASIAAVLAALEEAEPRWHSLTLGQIPGVDQFVTVAKTPLEVIAAILNFVAGILDVISKFLLAFPDPFRALILAAYTLLKSIIDDLLGSGAYVYFDAPGISSNAATLRDMGAAIPELPRWVAGDKPPQPAPEPDGFQQWAHRFEQSFDDPGDDNRPTFSDGASVEALFIVATAPQLANLLAVLPILAQLLDLSAFRSAWEKFLEGADDQDRAQLRSDSVAPDWRAWRLRDIGPPAYPLRELEKIPEYLKALLVSVDNIVELIKNLVKAIQSKVALLQELIKIIEAVIDMIKALSATGLHALAVSTDEGVAGLKKAFLEAGNRPNTDADGVVQTAHAVVGVCLLSGTSNILPIWALLGEDKSFAEAYQGAYDDWKGLADQGLQALKDTKALAVESVEGQQLGTGTPADLGFKGLWGDLGDAADAQKDAALRALGLGEAEADEKARSGRNALIAGLEQAAAEGTPLDPRVLAQIEATRRARRRGSRSLAMAYGDTPKPPGKPDGGR
ncbi:MAG: hypothetical protein H6842_06815 [Rhodospirillaceae bacterium]|nr:hypothetical protein [Rhodospirillaceae bacterium]